LLGFLGNFFPPSGWIPFGRHLFPSLPPPCFPGLFTTPSPLYIFVTIRTQSRSPYKVESPPSRPALDILSFHNLFSFFPLSRRSSEFTLPSRPLQVFSFLSLKNLRCARTPLSLFSSSFPCGFSPPSQELESQWVALNGSDFPSFPRSRVSTHRKEFPFP